MELVETLALNCLHTHRLWCEQTIAIEGLDSAQTEWTHSWTLMRAKVMVLMKQLLWFHRMLIVHIKWLEDTTLWFATVQR